MLSVCCVQESARGRLEREPVDRSAEKLYSGDCRECIRSFSLPIAPGMSWKIEVGSCSGVCMSQRMCALL